MKTRTIEFTSGELADLTSVLDEALQAMEKDDEAFEDKKLKARYKVLTQLYHKLMTPAMLAFLAHE